MIHPDDYQWLFRKLPVMATSIAEDGSFVDVSDAFLERLGYEDVLSKKFPKLIHCRISGFGADGPMGGLPGYDAVIQAMCGMFSINGMPASDNGQAGRTRIGIPLVDIGTGLFSAIGILMALVERQRSGQGQFIDMTLHDAGIALMNSVELCALAESLGSVESMITHPASMTHVEVPAEERRARGLSDGLVRLSVGIEDADDILADLEQALSKVG